MPKPTTGMAGKAMPETGTWGSVGKRPDNRVRQPAGNAKVALTEGDAIVKPRRTLEMRKDKAQ